MVWGPPRVPVYIWTISSGFPRFGPVLRALLLRPGPPTGSEELERRLAGRIGGKRARGRLLAHAGSKFPGESLKETY